MTIACPECGEFIPVPMVLAVLGSGMGPLGKYKIGVMSTADSTLVDEHAATHDVTEEE